MRRWLMRQIRDTAGDSAFATASLVVGLIILGYAIWEDLDLVQVFRFNLDLISLLKFIPIIGKKIANGLALIGFDKTLFFLELWAVVALIMRGMLLIIQICWRLLHGSFRKRHSR